VVGLVLLLAGAANGLAADWCWKAPPLAETLGLAPQEAIQPRDRAILVSATDEVVLTLGYTDLRAHSAKTGDVLWQRPLGQHRQAFAREVPGGKGLFLLPRCLSGEVGQHLLAEGGRYFALATHLQSDKRVLVEVWDSRDGTAVGSFTIGPVLTELTPPGNNMLTLALSMGEEGVTVAWVSPEGRIVVERRRAGGDSADWHCELPITGPVTRLSPWREREACLRICPMGASLLVVATWCNMAYSELHLLDVKTGNELQSARLPFSVWGAAHVPERNIVLLTANDDWLRYGWGGAEGDVLVALRAEDLDLVWSRNAEGVVSVGKVGLQGGYAYLTVIPKGAAGREYRSGEKVVCAEIRKLDVSDGADSWIIGCGFQQGFLPSKREKIEVQPRGSPSPRPTANPIIVGDRLIVVLPGFAYEEGKGARYQVFVMSCKDGRELGRVTVHSPGNPHEYAPIAGPVGLHAVQGRICLDTLEGNLFALSLR
jgi:hypothetical protein